MIITETLDIQHIQELAGLCYIDAYREIHTEEQNQFSFHEMYSTESLHNQIESQGSRFFILNDNGIDLGYVAIYPIAESKGPEWMLDKLYLLPNCKGKGYGKTMMQFVEQVIANQCQCPFTIRLKVNRRNHAVSFYQRFGYQITGKWDLSIADGRWIMDGYDMCKTITKI